MSQPSLEHNGIVLPGERRMRAGKHLDGRIWLDVDGRGRIDLAPAEAFKLGTGLLRLLGINVEYEYGGPAS